MSRLADRLRRRLGDFWYHTLLMFVVMRGADAINAFVVVVLVPHYLGPGELGAVMPLTAFATCLALPAYAFALTFSKEVNALATRREYGRLKSLVRGVFVAAAVCLAFAVALSHALMPRFLQRMRVLDGSVCLFMIAAAFAGCVAPVYADTLQALKRFRALALVYALAAPMRLVTMALLMPFRALAGFFAGQCAAPLVNMLGSVALLRRELAVPAEPYWTRTACRRFSMLFAGMLAYQLAGMIPGLVETAALRQHLPDVDSAAYYMTTRLSDIATFVASTLVLTLFPYTAELAERGGDTRPFVRRVSFVMLLAGCALALLFLAAGRPLLGLLPNGDAYRDYAWAIPWSVGITTLGALQTFHVNTEASARRFGFLKWWIPVNLGYAALLDRATACCWFGETLSLKTMLACFTCATLVRTACCIVCQSPHDTQGAHGIRDIMHPHDAGPV